ncbi:MAG: cell division protein SepF [Lachnospiraceae bacterium]|nr:cell division protein SepF [Lachnospiraceae bacterium]
MAWNLAEALTSKFGGKQDDYDEDYYLDDEDEVEEEKPAKKTRAAEKAPRSFGKISPFTGGKKDYAADHDQEVFAIQPTSMDDARQITDKLLDGWVVVLNTEACEEGLARRIFDFACGTVYALNCAFGRVSFSATNSPAGIYVITPENTNISGAFQENFMQ